MALPDGIATPSVRFSFWSSMADLVRLVMRSKARGLKTRLGGALALVLVGKWTGVIGPLLIQHAIDTLNRRVISRDPIVESSSGVRIPIPICFISRSRPTVGSLSSG